MTLRRVPSDFTVRECPVPAFLASLAPTASAVNRNAVYELTKTSLSTPEAVGLISKSIFLRPGSIDYAGLKDKHAVTTQLISIPAKNSRMAADLKPNLVAEGYTARLLGWSATPVTAESISGNTFSLTVRDLTQEASDEMARRAALLARGTSLIFINYFGDQRFGSARHNKGYAAKALIKADFETALKLIIGTPARKDTGNTRIVTRLAAANWGNWNTIVRCLQRCPERKVFDLLSRGGTFRDAFAALPHFTQTMVVEAYQSHIWNQTAAIMVNALEAHGAHIMHTEGLFGDNAFPAARDIPAEWHLVQMPVLARKSQLVSPWGEAAEQVLAAEGISVRDLDIPQLRRPFFGEAPRPLVMHAENFKISLAEPDDLSDRNRLKTSVEFTLGRGGYATIVMRALGQ